MRIEVGYGLEGVLPDVTARCIVDEIIIPRFQADDIAGGIDTGVDWMVKLIEGEALPSPTWQPTHASQSSSVRFAPTIFLGTAFLLAVLLFVTRGRLHLRAAALMGGLVALFIFSLVARSPSWT